jgi:alcohol dehydrogenase class IV
MGEDVSKLSVDDAARRAIEAVRGLTRTLNKKGILPLTLREVGVSADDLPAVAEATVMDGATFYNPREVVADHILVHLKNAL